MIQTERTKNRNKVLAAKSSFAKTCVSLFQKPPQKSWQNSKEAHLQDKNWKTIESDKTISQSEKAKKF